MANALTNPVRSRILSEINLRPLSPSQFANKVGGEISAIARSFRQLERWGYAEVIEERPARRGGVAAERVYRGLPSPYLQVASPFELTPRQRGSHDRRMLGSYCSGIVQAVETGTFDRELDRHLSWEVMLLDGVGRHELNRRLSQILDLVKDLESKAGQKLAESSRETIHATVGVTAFRSAQPVGMVLKSPNLGPRRRSLDLTPELAKVLSNRWRSRILRALVTEPMSPSRFVEKMGGDHSYISRCFRELAAWDWIEIDEERRGGRRGGGIERIYKLRQALYFDSATWRSLPPFVRTEVSSTLIATFFEQIAEALEAETLDADADRLIAWKQTALDREAWVALGEELNSLFHLLPRLQEAALLRTTGSSDQLAPTLASIICFGTPEADA